MVTPVWYGFNPAFFDPERGVLPRQEDAQIIKNDIKQLLLTVPGERIHRPNFGTAIRSSLFEQMTPELIDSLESNILLALQNNEPRLANPVVDVSGDPDNNRLNVSVRGTLSFDPGILIEVKTSLNLHSSIVK